MTGSPRRNSAVRHRWHHTDRHNARCERCGISALKRPHPHERRWFTEWRLADGSYLDNYNGRATPPCTPVAAAPAEGAMAAAARGWHVFPLRPYDKRPAFPDHTEDRCNRTDPRCREHHTGWEPRATIDPDRIRRAWQHGRYGVGIATGPSGLVVIDLDVPKPGAELPEEWREPGIVDGHDVLAAICEQAGQPLPLDTYTVTTPSGGTHLYYRHPAGEQLRNTTGGTTGSLGPLIDSRAHGGYVVAAGTPLPDGTYKVVHDVDPAPLPGWLTERLAPRPLPPRQPVRIELGSGRAGRYLTAAVTQQLAHIATATAGTRNTTLYRSAVALGQLVAGGALDADDTTAVLTRAGLDAGLRPTRSPAPSPPDSKTEPVDPGASRHDRTRNTAAHRRRAAGSPRRR